MKTSLVSWWCLEVVLLGTCAGTALGGIGLDTDARGRPDSPRWRRWVQGEVLVKFRDTSDPKLTHTTSSADLAISHLPAGLQKLHSDHGLVEAMPLTRSTVATPHTVRVVRGRDTYLLRFSDKMMDVREACGALANDDGVEYAEPNYLLYPMFIPNDPYFSSSGSWGQPYDDQWGLKQTRLPAAWDLVAGSNEVIVAVLDSGIDFSHIDLAGRIASNGWNYVNQTANPIDDSGHGTFGSGIIAAGLDNGIGISGISKYVRILPIKFLPASGGGSTANAVSGIYYAVNQGARVINLSFGGDPSVTLETAINDAHGAGVVLVAAAGNDSGVNLDFPASYRNVITVGASDHTDQLADFSNYGPRIDVFAPGGDSGGEALGLSILSLRAAGTSFGSFVGNGCSRSRGTSFSSPFVCGLVALMLNQRPDLENEEIRQILRMTADDILTPGWDPQSSYGRVNASVALQRNSALATLITSPVNFAAIGGTLNIQGFSRGNEFHYYLVERGSGQSPTNWTTLSSNNVPVASGTLATWDTTLVADGGYSLRLRSVDSFGASFEDRVLVTVSNFDPPYHPGWPYRSYQANKAAPVFADLDGDNLQEVIWGSRQSVTVRRHDGTAFPGWPQPTADVGPAGPPTVGDLDGDGMPEVAIIASDYRSGLGQICIWHANGTTKIGWPKNFTAGNTYIPHETSPVFADIDDDGRVEVIWCSNTNGSGEIHVDRHDGTSMPGWPVILPNANASVFSSPAAGDIDGDGLMDVAITTMNNQVYLLRHNGTIFRGWPVGLGSGGSPSGNPAFADVDHDGQLEVFAETYYGTVALYNGSGQLLPGWPQQVGWLPRSPAFADLDDDGRLEIAFGTQAGVLHVFHDNGTPLAGWPQTSSSRFYSPVIADLDQDGHLDLAASDGNAYVYGWNAQGNVLYELGLPIKAPNYVCNSAPVVGDADNDGRLEMLVLASEDYVMWDLSSHVDPMRMPYPMLMGDAAHQSRYKVQPRVETVSPAFAGTNQPTQLVIQGDFFLKGMKVFLGTNAFPVYSESATSIVVNLPGCLTPQWYDLIVDNVNSYPTTLSNAVVLVTSLEGDDDGDSLTNGWELLQGLDPHDDGSKEVNNGSAGDPDQDGMQNWQEQIAGSDPRNAESVFKIVRASCLESGDAVLWWASAPGRRYTLYGATNLSGDFIPLGVRVQATPPMNSYTNSHVGPGPWFYRVGVE